MEELMEGTSLEESGWFQGEIFQITCSVSWYGRFWSTTNFWYSWKRAPLPPSSLAGSRRGTEASRAAAWWFELLLRVSRWFVTRISSYFLSYFIQLCNAPRWQWWWFVLSHDVHLYKKNHAFLRIDPPRSTLRLQLTTRSSNHTLSPCSAAISAHSAHSSQLTVSALLPSVVARIYLAPH